MSKIDLRPGESSIPIAKPTKTKSGQWTGRFTVRLMDGRTKRIKCSAPTRGEWAVKAEAAAAEAIRAAGSEGSWTPATQMTAYIEAVSTPLVRESKRLSPQTKAHYERTLQTLAASFKGYTIRDATRFRRLETTLKNIAQERGSESARQARNVLSKWVLQQLIRDELLQGSPLAGVEIDLSGYKRTRKAPGGQALTEAEHRRVVEYLLAIDPAAGATPPKRGRYTTASRIRLRRSVIEVTLLQATAGLRIGEALSLEKRDLEPKGTELFVTVRAEVSKTKRGRTVPITDPRVAERIRQRAAELEATQLLFPAPATGETPWDHANCQKRLRTLYNELAEEAQAPLLATVSSHVWRATLSTIAMTRGVPAEIRAAYFGHTAEVNRSNYTDTTNVGELLEALAPKGH